MRTTLVALSQAVLCALVCGCAAAHPVAAGSAAAPETETRASPPPAPIRAPGDAQVGDHTTCPVSGEAFIVSATSPRAEHDGKTYYFCCADCAKKFEAEPARYLIKPKG